MKQVFHAKAAGGMFGRGFEPEPFMERYEFDATKMQLFPVVAGKEQVLPHSRSIDGLARARSERSVSSILSAVEAWADGGSLRMALSRRRQRDLDDLHRLVALQEELDWLCYGLYGVDDEIEAVGPEDVALLPRTWLPWALNLAVRDAMVRAAVERGEDPGDLPTAWFERQRWEPVTELPPEVPAVLRARIEARRRRIRENPALALIESPSFKRRWYRPDYEADEKEALETWLADHVEAAAKERGRTFSLEQVVATLQDDARVLAVCEVLTGRRDFNLSQLVAEALFGDAVPSHRSTSTSRLACSNARPGSAPGRTSAARTRERRSPPRCRPATAAGDFLKSEYWRLRGKLDVPKERFIAFTEVPGRSGVETLYGWAGWTPLAAPEGHPRDRRGARRRRRPTR